MKYQDELETLAQARKSLDEVKARRQELIAALESSPDYQSYLKLEADFEEIIEKADSIIREGAVNDFKATGEKKINDFISIRVMTSLEYDVQEALEWSKDHLIGALKLDKAFFEKHAKGVSDTQPLPFVKLVETPSATIATDLSAFLKEG